MSKNERKTIGSCEKSDSEAFSVESILEDFSFWFPRAREYGFSANELYETAEKAIAVSIPIPLLENGNYKLWSFHFCTVERISPRKLELVISDLSEMIDAKLSYLVHFSHFYVIADYVTRKIPPRCSRRSVYVIKSSHVYKVYEIVSKAIFNFSRSFRRNVKYGEGLIHLCDELEVFAERLRNRAEELRPLTRSKREFAER